MPKSLSAFPKMPQMNIEDEEMSEEQKQQIAMFEKMFGGTDFDRKLDVFIDKQLAAGVDMETIMKNAMNGMPGIDGENPFKDG